MRYPVNLLYGYLIHLVIDIEAADIHPVAGDHVDQLVWRGVLAQDNLKMLQERKSLSVTVARLPCPSLLV